MIDRARTWFLPIQLSRQKTILTLGKLRSKKAEGYILLMKVTCVAAVPPRTTNVIIIILRLSEPNKLDKRKEEKGQAGLADS